MASITAISLQGDNGKKTIQTMIENAEQWAADGWGGYIGPDFVKGGVVSVSLVTPKLTLDQAKASMKPLTDLGNSSLTSMWINITTLNEGYHEYMDTTFIKAFTILNNVGLAPASRLIPREFFQTSDKRQTLLDALTGIMEAGTPNPIVPYYVLLVPPASYALPDTDIPPNGPGAASVTPAWVRLQPILLLGLGILIGSVAATDTYVIITLETVPMAYFRPDLLGSRRPDGQPSRQRHPSFPRCPQFSRSFARNGARQWGVYE